MPTQAEPCTNSLPDACAQVPISDAEIVELASAFRYYGVWRITLDTSLFYGSPSICRIFDMEFVDGPMNLVELTARIHPEDLPMLMQAFERISTSGETYHAIYRVRIGEGRYKFVRTVGRYRKTSQGLGEIIGITYEFFAQQRTIDFFLDDGSDEKLR